MVSPAIHYLGVIGTAANQDHARCAGQWERIKAERSSEYGPDGAYNFGACIHGQRFIGRGWNRDSAANGQQAGVDYNPGSRALCALIGTEDAITPLLEQAIVDFAEEAFARGYPTPLKGHSDFVATGCPGDAMRATVDQFNKGELGMNEQQVRDIIDKHLFVEQPFGYTRFEANIEKYLHTPTIYVLTRFEAWWKQASDKFSAPPAA